MNKEVALKAKELLEQIDKVQRDIELVQKVEHKGLNLVLEGGVWVKSVPKEVLAPFADLYLKEKLKELENELESLSDGVEPKLPNGSSPDALDVESKISFRFPLPSGLTGVRLAELDSFPTNLKPVVSLLGLSETNHFSGMYVKCKNADVVHKVLNDWSKLFVNLHVHPLDESIMSPIDPSGAMTVYHLELSKADLMKDNKDNLYVVYDGWGYPFTNADNVEIVKERC